MHTKAKISLQYLPQFFNYSSLEHHAYKDMYEKRQYLLNKFVTKSNDLYSKKEKLFKAGKPEKWELSEENLKRFHDLAENKEEAFAVMLPKESKIVSDYEDSYMYLTTKWYNEIKKINKDDIEELKFHLQDYASKMSELLTESHLTWADFESALADNDSGEDGSKNEISKTE